MPKAAELQHLTLMRPSHLSIIIVINIISNWPGIIAADAIIGVHHHNDLKFLALVSLLPALVIIFFVAV